MLIIGGARLIFSNPDKAKVFLADPSCRKAMGTHLYLSALPGTGYECHQLVPETDPPVGPVTYMFRKILMVM